MNKRVREARKANGLNQTKFGERLGVTAAAISKIESGERALTEQMILAICREFKVNEEWLRTGEGERLDGFDDSNIAAVVDEYKLDEVSQKILKAYVELPEGHRKGANSFIYAMSRAVLEG
jgi:transcriptional regulator with XRE-family HTH domain